MKKLFPILLLIVSQYCLASSINSPDGNIKLWFKLNNDVPTYTIDFKNNTSVVTGDLGFKLSDNTSLGSEFKNATFTYDKHDSEWSPVLGEVKSIRNHYNSMTVNLEQADSKHIQIEFRVFNDGVGFRYHFPKQQHLNFFTIAQELTSFNMGGDCKAFWIPGDYDSNEFSYSTTKLSDFDAKHKEALGEIDSKTVIKEPSVQTPVMLKNANNIYINIHEAALVDFPAMALNVNSKKFTFNANLAPDPLGNRGRVQTPFVTPWRTIVISDRATEILASKLILNLNEPCKIEDTSWIKPLKYIGVWWELFLPNGKSWCYTDEWNFKIDLYDYTKSTPNGRHGANTDYVKQHIDFAAKHGFDAVLVEGWNTGWEDWCRGIRELTSDFVTPYPDFDVKQVNEYAKSKGVSLIMHHETAGSISNYERRMDDAYRFMNKYGYPALKSGYVGPLIPFGEYHYGQTAVNHFNYAIEKAVDYKIMINAHEPVRPTGLHRTYPNYLACESARGTEYEAFGHVNPDHQTILPFTRLMGGPMDYTPGIFQTDFSYYDKNSTRKISTTIAKQLALYVVFYSPLQMAADLPGNYERFADAFQFIKDVAVDWDDTKYLEAEPGEYITVARKAKGSESWFAGAITNGESRDIKIKTDFLDPKKKYEATIYADGKDADYVNNAQSYQIKKMKVTSKSVIKAHLARSGGVAISFKEI